MFKKENKNTVLLDFLTPSSSSGGFFPVNTTPHFNYSQILKKNF